MPCPNPTKYMTTLLTLTCQPHTFLTCSTHFTRGLPAWCKPALTHSPALSQPALPHVHQLCTNCPTAHLTASHQPGQPHVYLLCPDPSYHVPVRLTPFIQQAPTCLTSMNRVSTCCVKHQFISLQPILPHTHSLSLPALPHAYTP